MSLLCIAVATAAAVVILPTSRVTLSWTHTVEGTPWEEDYVVAGPALLLSEARVRRSGAGMEPGPDAYWRAGWWHFRPELPQLEQVVLANSLSGQGYSLCSPHQCWRISELVGRGEPVTLKPLACGASR